MGGNLELDYRQTQRARLTELLNQAVDITNKQNALAASKQDLSQQLRVIMVEGQRMTTLLRKSIAAHYGVRAEKLAEFGLQPSAAGPGSKSPPSRSRRSRSARAHRDQQLVPHPLLSDPHLGGALRRAPFFCALPIRRSRQRAILPRQRAVVRGDEPSSSCFWLPPETTARRLRRWRVVSGDGPSSAEAARCLGRYGVVGRRWAVVANHLR